MVKLTLEVDHETDTEDLLRPARSLEGIKTLSVDYKWHSELLNSVRAIERFGHRAAALFV